MLSMNFLITCLIVVLIPGTGVIFTVSTGLMAASAPACSPRWAVPLGSSRTYWRPYSAFPPCCTPAHWHSKR